MSNIDKQALREEFRYMRDHYNDPADRKKQEIYIAAEALLDELDKKQQYIKLRDQENEDIALTVGKLRVELEAAKKRIAELEKGHQEAAKQINSWRRLAKQNIAERGKDISELEAARQRIAELEAKLETADKLQDGAFRDGLKAGFSYGQTDDQSGFAQCMSVYSTRTDIGVKVE
ncbi:ead/Ea22-like family protein [Salmonella enterica]|uniref:Ead/Ea22-like family protein n=2 Tax=Salmonella enterica TaxID=28901 RepID=A0A3R0FRS6_SALER|nr:ead/Ea22-like family protein [Salmonella enterica]EBP3719807.1 ead/Ea22-like family protein [Salmonella enterica subsp. enterica]EBX0068548.1 ead/Ea22-like family protein [Salmonella enterica subsp. enterica serovar Gaminara]ECL9698815.1 ead/Ea22-like family protein [Salmonella enterica subsp. enterica serovar Rubislaw]EDC1984092.1 ead/Ea22-like family protein [Salmonella enterica subsp. enterica serovar Muenchen]